MKLSMTQKILILLPLVLLLSCRPGGEVFVSDRHSGSYPYLLSHLEKEAPATLILLDYHHDMGPGPSSLYLPPGEWDVTSFNWLGGLVDGGMIGDVYWVSGRDLLLPNRNARLAWLNRKTGEDPPHIGARKREAVHIIDWSDLNDLYAAGQFSGPVALSLDLDILTVDPGDSPEDFLDEMLDFIDKLNPPVLTVAFSAAYQPEASLAWKWFAHSLKRLGSNRRILMAGGEMSPRPEGNEELRRWSEWKERGIKTDFSAFFAPGAALWDMAPALFWQELISLPLIPTDDTMAEITGNMLRARRENEELRREFPEKQLEKLARQAAQILTEDLSGMKSGEPDSGPALSGAERGLAVRFISRYEDRGCIAYYRGIENPSAMIGTAVAEAAFHDPRYEPVRADELEDLDVEVTLFGDFTPLDSPEDFIPSLDSLILEYEGERTLLQASLAQERNLSRRQFLRTLSRKSGLGEEGWKQPGVRFYRAPSVRVRLPVSQREK